MIGGIVFIILAIMGFFNAYRQSHSQYEIIRDNVPESLTLAFFLLVIGIAIIVVSRVIHNKRQNEARQRMETAQRRQEQIIREEGNKERAYQSARIDAYSCLDRYTKVFDYPKYARIAQKHTSTDGKRGLRDGVHEALFDQIRAVDGALCLPGNAAVQELRSLQEVIRQMPAMAQKIGGPDYLRGICSELQKVMDGRVSPTKTRLDQLRTDLSRCRSILL